MTNTDTVIVHTDGGCAPTNPGPGGWGALIEYKGQTMELCGGESKSTNSRMELVAAIRALEAVPPSLPVTMRVDSKYVLEGITSWIQGWERRGWVTAAGEPVKNEDLWRALSKVAAGRSITWEWVRGHTGDPGNERADELADKGRTEALEKAST